MVRQDVWDAHCVVPAKVRWTQSGEVTIEKIVSFFEDSMKEMLKSKKEAATAGMSVRRLLSDHLFREYMVSIPFQTTAATHLVHCIVSDDYSDEERQMILRSCAELARVEYIMGMLHHSWNIPSLGGQEPQWDTRTKLLSEFASISKVELEK
jgi:hypothetical protein